MKKAERPTLANNRSAPFLLHEQKNVKFAIEFPKDTQNEREEMN
jgi:hypothetical protein